MAAQPPTDPFDLSALRLPQDFAAQFGLQAKVGTVPVGKPPKQQFFRIRPGEDWRIQTMVMHYEPDRESYLIAPAMWTLVPDAKPVLLVYGITRQNSPFLWPLKLPTGDSRGDTWAESAIAAAQLAEKTWIRMAANMSLGGYQITQATALDLPDPTWPDMTFQEVMRTAFKDRLIGSNDHPVMRALRGEA